MQKNGYFVISLDFELLWGVFDVVDYKEKVKYFRSTRKVIPETLEVFEEYRIHATWAVVGMLFNRDWDEWQQNIPDYLPNYQNRKLSAYKFGNSIKSRETEEMVFAPELVREINRVSGQEVATHTYSHYYCLEPGQDLDAFRADMEKAVKMAGKLDVELKSLVFPRNQFRDDYLKVCAELGIENVRSNPDSWYWKDTVSEALWYKIARSGDAYLPLGKKSYLVKDVKDKSPVQQKASRFFRPVESNPTLRKLKLNRIKNEMKLAAKNNEVYHLWWHPHNFGAEPTESLKDLREVLDCFAECREEFGFQSANMQEMSLLMN